MKNTLMATTAMLLMASSPLAAIAPQEVNNFLTSFNIKDGYLSYKLSKLTDTEWANFKNFFTALSSERSTDKCKSFLIEMVLHPKKILEEPSFLPAIIQLTQGRDGLDLFDLYYALNPISRNILNHENFLPATLTLSQGIPDAKVSELLSILKDLPVKHFGLKNFLTIINVLSQNKNVSERINATHALKYVSENVLGHDAFLSALTTLSQEHKGITGRTIVSLKEIPLSI